MLRAWSEYLSKEDEKQVISKLDYIEEPNVKAVATLKEITEVQQLVKKVHVSEEVKEYIVSIVNTARKDPDLISAPSTRATVSLFKGSRTLAFLNGRDYVLPDDVKHLVMPALTHRLRIKPEAEMEEVTPKVVIERILNEVPVPKV
jgi:MoxR-like ATPase